MVFYRGNRSTNGLSVSVEKLEATVTMKPVGFRNHIAIVTRNKELVTSFVVNKRMAYLRGQLVAAFVAATLKYGFACL